MAQPVVDRGATCENKNEKETKGTELMIPNKLIHSFEIVHIYASIHNDDSLVGWDGMKNCEIYLDAVVMQSLGWYCKYKMDRRG